MAILNTAKGRHAAGPGLTPAKPATTPSPKTATSAEPVTKYDTGAATRKKPKLRGNIGRMLREKLR